MKKIILTAMTATLLSAPTLAQDKLFDGGYIGAEAGVVDSQFTAGGYIGYRKQLKNDFVVGLEGSYSYYDIKTRPRFNRDRDGFGAAGVIGKVYGRGLFFGTAGYLNAKTDVSGPIGDFSKRRHGYSVGGGYEHKITDYLSARVKTEYVDMGERLSGVKATAGISFNF